MEQPQMPESFGRKVLMFPLTRIVLSVLVAGAVGFTGAVLLGESRITTNLTLAEGLEAVATLAGLAFIVLVIERRRLKDIGLGLRGAGRSLAMGFLLGGGILTVVVGILAAGGWYRVTDVGEPGRGQLIDAPTLTSLATELFVFFLLVGVAEEILFRGILFRVLQDGWGTWVALGISSLLFGLVHMGNPNATLLSGLAIASEAGILLGAAYMLTRDLWFPIGIHWAWNFFEGPVFGTRVSGIKFDMLLQSRTTGPELLTGGSFGPEGGLIALIVATGTGVLLLWMAVKKGHITPPGRREPPIVETQVVSSLES